MINPRSPAYRADIPGRDVTLERSARVDQGKVLIVIPAFNEERNIPTTVDQIRSKAPGVDILIVDDGSRDRTARAAEKAGALVAKLPFNMGYGAAVQTGFKFALMKRYQYVVQMDADGQHDPASIQALLDEIRKGDVDVVIGSRFLADSPRYEAALSRRAGIYVFRKVVSIITGQRSTDPTSGFQALNRDALRFYASPYYPVDYPDADVIIMLHKAGLRIREIPVTMHARMVGESMHSGLKPVYYLFKMFLSIFVTLLRNDRFVRRVDT
ncbi:MAG: glycosyltransferase family 2 protein [Nitrospirota bacterium]